MECKTCKAYGIDNLSFFGCLIMHEMLDKPNGKVGCYLKDKSIIKSIEKVKLKEPRSKYYNWINDQYENIN